jgi:hypothetical protein
VQSDAKSWAGVLLALKFSPRELGGVGAVAGAELSRMTGADGRGWAATVDAANIVRMPNSGSDNVRRFKSDKWNLPRSKSLWLFGAPPGL